MGRRRPTPPSPHEKDWSTNRVTWFKVDDSLHSHPKAMAVSLTAVGLWTVAGSWSSDHLTDGFIPDHMVTLLSRGQAELPKELCAAGLWKRTRGGFRFHQWHEDGDGSARNPSKEEVVSVRQKRAEAGRKGGLASGKTRSKPASKREAFASAGASRIVEPPSRPVPSRRDGDGSVGGHLQVADARANDGRQQLRRTYDLTDDKAEQAMTTISKLSKEPVKDWPSLLDHMAGNGTLAAIVEPLQRPEPPPAAEPDRRTTTGCDTHPEGAIDPLAPDGWGRCLFCNDRRRKAQRSIRRFTA